LKLDAAYTVVYIVIMTPTRKPVEFRGTSLDDLKTFPSEIRNEMGYQIDLVQQGNMPTDWKAMKIVGPGVCEIRVRGRDSIYRSIYLSRKGDKVYILHCFQKKTQKTAQTDIDVACQRMGVLEKDLQKAETNRKRTIRGKRQ